MNDFSVHVKPLIAEVPGWLTDEEGEALYDLARACTGAGVIVEIGSWKGKSTICLGRGSLAGAAVPIYAIDPHADYRFGDFKANVDRAGITDLVRPVTRIRSTFPIPGQRDASCLRQRLVRAQAMSDTTTRSKTPDSRE